LAGVVVVPDRGGQCGRQWSPEEIIMKPTTVGDHAVVLGASMAGLLTARVLIDAYDHVTVIERDVLPPDMAYRRGVPQGHHVHVLHARGRELLDELFPGFTEQVVQTGAVIGDSLGIFRWQLSGHQLRQLDIGLPALGASRPFLEGHVRRRVRALPSVRFAEGCDLVALVTDSDQGRVTGVRVAHRDEGGTEQTVSADLVVDATGRGSRTPVWLEQLGYPRPEVDRIEIGLGYASRRYRLGSGALGNDMGILTAPTPGNPRGGGVAPLEGGLHIVTVGGILGDHPPLDSAGFEAFVTSMCTPDVAKSLVGATPVDDPVPFRFPASVRHRYERLRRFPAGLLVIGDAVCSFNPIYGQGMTVAAMEAVTLRSLLRIGFPPEPQQYFRRIAKVIDTPWEINVGADLAFAEVPGRRTIKVRMVNTYLPALQAAASTDGSLACAMVRVLGMVDRPEGLLRPDRLLRVLWAHLRGIPAPASGPASGGGARGPAARHSVEPTG
jgi:2-polyprenyl-6-methoxyphenol hydroxylase-like FAD-dependent oxidoreductase